MVATQHPEKSGKFIKRFSVLILTLVVMVPLAVACTSTGGGTGSGASAVLRAGSGQGELTGSGSGATGSSGVSKGISAEFSTQEISASSAFGRQYTVYELRKDFRQFRAIMERKTVGLYTDRARLTAILDEAEATLTEPMTELQFYRLLAPIVAELRCGHSFLSVSAGMEGHLRAEALFFPLGVRIFGDRLFVVEDGHGLGVAPGSEILVLNGMAAAELIQHITANVVTDGRDQGRPRRDAELWFVALYYSYVDNPATFELELVPPGSDLELSAELPPGLPPRSGPGTNLAVTLEIPAVRDPVLAAALALAGASLAD